MEYKYKYFDTIDEEYIQFFSQKFISSLEDLERIKNAKKEKYKDIDLDSLHKIHFETAVLYDIYMEIVWRLGFKDQILLYKWYVENYDHGIGIKTPDQVKQFYKELSCILNKGRIEDLKDFNQYVDNEFQKVINNTNNTITNDKFDYKLMTELLHPYIPNATAPNYRSIIEYHVLPEDKKLTMSNNNKANIIRFAYCFGIRISEINRIFNIKVKSNNRPKEYKNDFYKLLKLINPAFSPPQK
jgi:hypothetical protein